MGQIGHRAVKKGSAVIIINSSRDNSEHFPGEAASSLKSVASQANANVEPTISMLAL